MEITTKPDESVQTVMDGSISTLQEICSDALRRFDDYMQEATDRQEYELAGNLAECYHEVENILQHLKTKGTLSYSGRNQLRCILKGAMKEVSVKLALTKPYQS